MSKIFYIVFVLLIAFILLLPNFIQAVDVNMNLGNTTSYDNTYTNTSSDSTTNNHRNIFFY